jgi:hypothetical protein
MAVTTRDGLIAAMGAGMGAQFMKSSITTVAGFNYSLFRTAGMPGAAAIPGTAAGNTCDRTLAGAILLPVASNTTYMTTFQASCTTSGVLRLADRLVETGALSFVTTTAQTVNSVALPTRATGALDVELWLEVYTAGGATASATVTCSYTNQAGTAGRTATLLGGIPASGVPAQRSYQFSLQAGDTGVQSVQTFTSGTSTVTAGAGGLVLRRRLSTGSIPGANLGFNQGYAETGLEKIPDAACIEMLWLASGTASGVIQGAIDIAQG